MAKGTSNITLILSGATACLAISLLITCIALFRISFLIEHGEPHQLQVDIKAFQKEIKALYSQKQKEHQKLQHPSKPSTGRVQLLVNRTKPVPQPRFQDFNITAKLTELQNSYESKKTRNRDFLLTYLLSKQKEIRHTITKFMCSEPWKWIHEKMCVRIVEQKKNWEDAREACKAEKADLVSIKAASQAAAIVKFLRNKTPSWYWIGLHGRAEHRFYRWSHNHEALSFTYWKPREPGHDGDCVNMDSNDGQWDNDLCGARLPFICQKHFFRLT